MERTKQVAAVNEELRRLRDELRLVVDTIPQQIWSGPPDGSLDYCNERWRSYMGLSHEELQGDGWQKMLHPQDRERVLRAWRESISYGTLYEQEERHRGVDGSYRWFLARGVPLRDATGRIVRWYGSNTDVEDRRRAEDELRRQKEILQKIFEHIPVMIAFIGKQWQIELANPECERSLGWTLEEIREHNVDVFAEAYPDPQYRRMVMDFVSAATGEWKDVKVRTRYGRVMDVAVAVVPVSDSTSIAIGRDITGRKQTEEALREAQVNLARITRVMAMGELAAAIAHEVNQPLAAIVTNANFCLRQLAKPDPGLEDLREAIFEIVNDGTRASAVIARIRALFQKGIAGRAELDINPVIQEVAALLRDEINRNDVSLRTELDRTLPTVSGDPVQLQQVLINLIMNAIDAMRSLSQPHRELLIKSGMRGNEVCIEVRDSGEGLNPDHAEHIFDPFFTTKPEGIGMGLSISRSIVESHGGHLWTTPGSPHGAIFYFTLPGAGELA
jgi:PAS domain S-box-containing protein